MIENAFSLLQVALTVLVIGILIATLMHFTPPPEKD